MATSRLSKAFGSMQETLYLVRKTRDAQDLRDAIAELDAGKGVEHVPFEPAKPKRR